ncbi:MAG: amidohydrolase family protein, partial [Alphaproteobacteria bacterium]|nr:amidohydrolase family protein [Alphaproteobacteria bacterium]
MSRIAITDAQLWDGETDAPVPATVVVEGNRIAAVAPAGEPVADLPEERIDGAGMTLMPGMVEGHCHPSFTG